MTISFDLDDTLILMDKNLPQEPKNLFQKLLTSESLRLGTVQLLKHIKAQNHNLLIYTTSYRSSFYIKFLFWTYGVAIDRAINQAEHLKLSQAKTVSKYPPAFGIDLHIDDSAGVGLEGERYGFKTLILDPYDENWVDCVLKIINC